MQNDPRFVSRLLTVTVETVRERKAREYRGARRRIIWNISMCSEERWTSECAATAPG